MPADRLAELHRQRALLREHLAWLDREIAEASPRGDLPAPPLPPAAPASPPAGVLPTPPAPVKAESAATVSPAALAPEAILDEYRVAPDTLRTDVRKGCFLYFVGAFAVLAVCVMVLYYALSRR